MASPSNKIPTSKIPVLQLFCYHACVYPTSMFGQHIELVDPEPGTRELLMAWCNDTDPDVNRPKLRHLELHDRKGRRNMVCVRYGTLSSFLGDTIRFEVVTDHESVEPNPGVREMMEAFETGRPVPVTS